MAQELAQPELEAHALTTIGCAKMDANRGGREELERALQIAVAANSAEAAGILVNLGVEAFFAGDIRREHAFMVEAEETAERYGARDMARFSLGNRIFTCWALGGWDEALGLADDFIAECERAPHYQEQLVRNVRAWIRFGRGDEDGALADAERTLEQARQGAGPQSTLAPLAQCSFIYAKLGRLAEARALADEAIEYGRAHPHFAGPLHIVAPVAQELGIEEALRDVLAAAPERAFNQAARAGAAGDHSRAADLYAAMGSPSLEAGSRLAAAENLLAAGRRDEGEAELERALAFHRSVGATAYLKRGETLLTASA